ncbi:hypothetical protein E2562_013392, partial [Oryza meyeriana var. granulata]
PRSDAPPQLPHEHGSGDFTDGRPAGSPPAGERGVALMPEYMMTGRPSGRMVTEPDTQSLVSNGTVVSSALSSVA